MVLLLDFTAQNRRVALITNVKPGKLRDVVSEGLVYILSYLANASYIVLLPVSHNVQLISRTFYVLPHLSRSYVLQMKVPQRWSP